MYKSQLLDMFIILFGVLMAWTCAWKSKHYFNLEQFNRGAAYALLVIILLIVVIVEAARNEPWPD